MPVAAPPATIQPPLSPCYDAGVNIDCVKGAGMTKRFKEWKRDELTPEQAVVWEGVAAARKGAFPTPFHVLLENPDLCRTVTSVGAICRYKTGLSPRLSELAILTVAAHWRCAYEFAVHAPEARKGGVPEHEIAALSEGRRPAFTDKQAALLYDYVSELLDRRDVSDTTFAAATAELGRKTVVELTGLVGYYSLLAITMLAYRVPAPDKARG